MKSDYLEIKTTTGEAFFIRAVATNQLHIAATVPREFYNSPYLKDEMQGYCFNLRGTEYRQLKTWVNITTLGASDWGFTLDDSIYCTRVDDPSKEPAPTHKALAGGLMLQAVTSYAKNNPKEFSAFLAAWTKEAIEQCASKAAETLEELESAAIELRKRLAELQSAKTMTEQTSALEMHRRFIRYAVKIDVSSEYI